MAVAANQLDSKLKIVLNAGLDENSKDIIKNKTFAKIKPTVENEDLYSLGVAVTELQAHSLVKMVRYEEYELVNEII